MDKSNGLRNRAWGFDSLRLDWMHPPFMGA